MRLIDADALREIWVCQPGHDFEPSSFVYSIDNAPTVEPDSPWHRVEEELPKESNTYIVYLRQGTKVETPEWMGGEPLSYVTEMAFDREQMLWRADDDAYNAILSFVDTERDFHVTHWMEKPKPPKEDADANK